MNTHEGIGEREGSPTPLSLKIGMVIISLVGLAWGIYYIDGSHGITNKRHWEELASINNTKMATYSQTAEEAKKYQSWDEAAKDWEQKNKK